MGQFNVSIVVPVYNEAAQVISLVNRLDSLKDYVKDIIIVDGGSNDDGDVTLAKHFTLIQSEKGRAQQMNAGAQLAQGTWIIFLHADTHLSASLLRAMVDQASLHQWGRFDVKLDARGFVFRVIEWFINHRSRLTGVATGDQCIFVRKRLFDELKGFTEIPLMEDVDFSKRAKKMAPPKCLKQTVITSARRWQTYGLVKTVLLMWQLRYAFWRGVSPEKLAEKYR